MHQAKKVLVVEDSPSINKLLTSKIGNQLHIEVASASSMEEAAAILEDHADEFFVAVLDLNLPDAPDGEIVDFVLSMGVPPIILTGTISDDLHDEMMKKAIIDYVVKRNLNEIDYIVETINRLRDNSQRKVLVVDDSASSRHLMTMLLRRHYLNVYQACDGEEALVLLEEHDDVVLIITDYNMPNMDGVELVSRVREKYSRHEIGIIGLSSSGPGKVSIKLLKSGANDFIGRPFLHEEFYCRVNQNIDAIISYTRLKEVADRDFLTGCFNRQYLSKVGGSLFQNALRDNITLAAAMLDIDFFKKINDTHGHHIGDMALKHVAAIFNEQLRESDVIARIGGEEFCLLSVNIDEANVEAMLERFRQALVDSPLLVEEVTVPMTVSIGYTVGLNSSLERMMADADLALYQAKETGRNRVVGF